MFIFNNNSIADYDLDEAQEFVLYWKQFYKNEVTAFNTADYISYIHELNIGNNLTEDNVKKLLRWKDPHRLTEKIMSGANKGENNSKVQKVLAKLKQLNKFRNGEITCEVFLDRIKDIFPNGLIWKIFLLHISKPSDYPIADQNTFRVFELHTNNYRIMSWEKYDLDWDKYKKYREYFWGITDRLGIERNNITIDNFINLKKIDEALFEFGKFIKKYYIE